MNILILVDKHGSAIHRLAESVRIHNPHLNIKVCPVHPKRNTTKDLFQAQDYMKWADLIDVHYWRSGEVVRSAFPTEWAAKKKLLCHFNPYDVDKLSWNQIYDEVVVGNREISHSLPYAKMIPYCIDLSFFKFNKEYTKEPVINMVSGRIEGKKGVLEVAKACRELGYKFRLVGRVSKGDYMQELLKEGGANMTFIENATEEILIEEYSKAMIHVCNSVDNFESGTLPILEAMACGVPVLTRNIGHVPDIDNGANMVVRKGKVDDVEDIKKELKAMVENEPLRLKIRDRAFQTVKNRYDKKMARQFSNLYYRMLNKDPMVSIIIPTKDRGEPIGDCLAGAVTQSYSNYEIVIADSGEFPIEGVVRKLRNETKVPIKYIHFEASGYSLAEARNRAVIEAQGEILVFCDDRINMDREAVQQFVESSKSSTWLWGVKDNYQKAFVENFASVRREDLIRGGLFCERINKYGGMSQEIRERFTAQGYAFEIIDSAKASTTTRSTDRSKKREDTIESKLLLFKMYGD